MLTLASSLQKSPYKMHRVVPRAAALGTVVILLALFAINAHRKLGQQNLSTGFDFLFRSTGWNISFSLMPYSTSDPYWWVLLVGFQNSLFVGVTTIATAMVIGTIIGFARTGSNPLLGLLSAIYVEIFRNVPLLLQAFFWYAVFTHLPPAKQAYGLWQSVFLSNRGILLPWPVGSLTNLAIFGCVLGAVAMVVLGERLFLPNQSLARKILRSGLVIGTILVIAFLVITATTPLFDYPIHKGLRFQGGLQLAPELLALLTAIILYGAAYIAEIVRGGLLSVPRGQLEAARSLGLRPFAVNRLVRFPLAIRAMLPALSNQFVWLMKATTIGIAIGFSDLFMVATIAINQSGNTVEIIFILLLAFLLINVTLAAAMNAFNRKVAIKGHRTAGPSHG